MVDSWGVIYLGKTLWVSLLGREKDGMDQR
jgi:hypothetical protein